MRRFFGYIRFVHVIIPCVVMANTEVKVSGQVRFRREVDKPASRNAGWELDFAATSSWIRGTLLVAGLSFFFPGVALSADLPNRESGYWGYFMATVNF